MLGIVIPDERALSPFHPRRGKSRQWGENRRLRWSSLRLQKTFSYMHPLMLHPVRWNRPRTESPPRRRAMSAPLSPTRPAAAPPRPPRRRPAPHRAPRRTPPEAAIEARASRPPPHTGGAAAPSEAPHGSEPAPEDHDEDGP